MVRDSIIDVNSNRARWRITTLILFFALGIEIYALLNDIPWIQSFFLDQPRQDHSDSPIAQLMSHKNTVRTQSGGEIVWSEASPQQGLHWQDSILTLERSKAEIAFLDGAGLIIDENSLIQLQRRTEGESNSQRITVKLLRGSLRKIKGRANSDSTQELSIQVGDTLANLSNDSELTIVANPTSPEGGQIQVQAGEIRLETPSGTLLLKRDEETTLNVTKNSKIQPVVKPAIFVLRSPTGGENIEADVDAKVKLRWNVNGHRTGGDPLEVEVSQSPDFKQDVHRLRIGATTPPLEYVEAKIKLPIQTQPARWFWRVRTASENSIFSHVESFWIQPKFKKQSQGFILNPIPTLLPPPAEIFAPEISPMPPKRRHR
jgi:hypothetical protein